jgi:hypothetical protein
MIFMRNNCVHKWRPIPNEYGSDDRASFYCNKCGKIKRVK